MTSETVDPIDWLHPPPYTGQYPLSSTYCTLQCWLGCKSQDLLHWVSRERATYSIGNIWPAYPNFSEYFKYLSGCIVCISNGSLNLIWFSFAYVFLYFCNSCLFFYALIDEIKCIYLFYLLANSGKYLLWWFVCFARVSEQPIMSRSWH